MTDKELLEIEAEEFSYSNSKLYGHIYNKGRKDERAKVIEILKKCVYEIPYENSAFGYGMKVVDYSKVMKMLKEQ